VSNQLPEPPSSLPPPEQGETSASASPRNVLVGALAVILIGSFLPWASATAPFIGTINKNGVEGDGLIVAAISGLGLFQLLFGSKKKGQVPSTSVWLGLVVAAVCIYDIVDVQSANDDLEFGVVQVGVGLWMSTAGALVVFALGLKYREKSARGSRRVLRRRGRSSPTELGGD